MLKDKIALVTGGSRGIGSSICTELAKAGATVIINYSNSKDSAEEVLKKIESASGSGEVVKFDVSDSNEVEKSIKEIIDKYEKIDILVNNAGITRDSLFMRMKENQWDEVFETNIKGVFNCTKNVIRMMIKNQYGKIINISSPGSTKVLNNYFSIGVSKAALESLTRYMAYDLAKDDISVNSISASLLETDAIKHFPNQEEIKSILSRKNPKQKKLIPNDVAKFAVSLCSEAGDMVIGQNILIDGGDTLLLR